MIPNEPLPATDHQPSETRDPFWTYSDLLLFVFFVFSSIVIILFLLELVPRTARGVTSALLAQMAMYALAFGALKAMFFLRYRQPFWRSLGWKPLSFGPATASLFAGPVLALALVVLSVALHTPEVPPPFEQLAKGKTAIIILGLLVVVLGPLAEELAFRGFLMPLLIRSFRPAAGIVLAGVIFGCFHGYEYEWSWRYMLLISAAGCAFGWAKQKTGSTAAAAYMHSTFNLIQFGFFLMQSRTL